MAKAKFKVIADGSFGGTQVFSPEGEDITRTIKSIAIKHEAGELPTLCLEIYDAEIDVTTLADETRTFVATGK